MSKRAATYQPAQRTKGQTLSPVDVTHISLADVLQHYNDTTKKIITSVYNDNLLSEDVKRIMLDVLYLPNYVTRESLLSLDNALNERQKWKIRDVVKVKLYWQKQQLKKDKDKLKQLELEMKELIQHFQKTDLAKVDGGARKKKCP